MDSTNWKQKYEDQIRITDSLKRDLAHLQGHTIMPCPAATQMGEHACTNQHACWEPCGVMGNDERFVAQSKEQNDAAFEALGVPRQPNCDVTFRGVKITSGPPPSAEAVPASDPEPLMLPLRSPSRRGKAIDDGKRRRKSD